MIEVINIKNGIPENGSYYYIGRGKNSILGNPFTHIKDKITKAEFIVYNRETAIESYKQLFYKWYKENIEIQTLIDEIYEKHKNNEIIYLGCWCKPLSCHGDIIKQFIENKLLKDKIKLNILKK